MSIISSVRDFLLTCPLFDDIPITVDYLPSSATEASIEAIPVPYTVKQYTDGSKICNYQFVVAVRFPWYSDENEGISCSKWFEDFSTWLEIQSNLNNLPNLPDGLSPISIYAVPNRFGTDGKNSSARYQMVCRLTFFKDKP